MKRLFLALIVATALPPRESRAGGAPEPGTPAARHEAVVSHLKKAAADASARSLAGMTGRDDWEARGAPARRELLYVLGLDPLPKRTPLEAKVTGTVRRPGFRMDKVVFQSLPRLYVTANFYLPDPPPQEETRPRKLPTVLYVCGHAPGPAGAKAYYQQHGAWYARHGFACLMVDTLEFGEVPGLHHGIHDLNQWDWLSRGYTPAGVEVWNAVRALDWLETRPEVDAKRIGLTGISGGGATTWFAAAADDRVAAAASVCGTWTFGSQAAHWRAAGQCDCIYFHNTFGTDLPDAGALVAPRPLLICGGRKDDDFPPDGFGEVFEKLRRVYGFYGKEAAERVRLVDEDVGHTDSPLFKREARRWMARWLKNEPRVGDDDQEGNEPPYEPIPAAELACLGEPPADAINDQIHRLFIPTATFDPAGFASLAKWEQRRRDVLEGLKTYVFRAFPREALPFNERTTRNDGGWAARYADYQEVFIESEPGVPVRLQVLRPKDAARRDAAPVLIYAKRAGDSIYAMDFDELLPLLGRYTVVILNPRLTEHPVTPFERAELERTASWSGRTVASMQAWDVLRTVQWAATEGLGLSGERGEKPRIALYGKGEMGALALYAGLLDERAGQVILDDPPTTHRSALAPALLNVLRVTDLQEVAAAFAPRRLVFVSEIPSAFIAARPVYDLLGAGDRLKNAGSLGEAMRGWED